MTIGGLVRYSVFFVIKLKTRAVEIAGITTQPFEAWMKQLARNLTDVHDGFLHHTRYIILDRDPLYTAAFRRMLQDSGVKSLRLPARSPNLNAYAERFVLSANLSASTGLSLSASGTSAQSFESSWSTTTRSDRTKASQTSSLLPRLLPPSALGR